MRDDLEFNIQFCEEIEKYPTLYDFTRSDYCNRSVQDKAWQTIARKFNESASDCKERWKNIRGRYSKYNKKIAQPSGSGVKPIKEYYLAPHLQFLNRFLKSRPCKGNMLKPNEREDMHAVSDEDEDGDNGDGDGDGDGDEEHDQWLQDDLPKSLLSITSPSASFARRKRSPPAASDCYRQKRTRTLNDVNETVYNYFEERRKRLTNKNVAETPDPDMAFLQSVLPDMKSMNDHQKRRFKIGILNLAEQILEQCGSNCSQDSGSRSREVVAPSRYSVVGSEPASRAPSHGATSTISTRFGHPENEALIFMTENDRFKISADNE